MVGSRETPKEILVLMEKLAYKLAQWGWCGRSGAAGGADTCLEEGVYRSLDGTPIASGRMEIYLPWKDFNGRCSSNQGYYTLPDMPNKKEAEELASELHPAWENCSQGAKKLHSRNIYQVLGQDLKTPSKFLVCYAQPVGTDGHVKGGTGTAVKLALDNNVEVFNMYIPADRKRIEDWVGG